MLYLARTLGCSCGCVHLGLINSIRTPTGHERVFINEMPPMESHPAWGGRAWIEEIMQEHLDDQGESMRVHVWSVSGMDQPMDVPFWSS